MNTDHPIADPSGDRVRRLETARDLGFFERYLTVWVLLCMAVGIGLGALLPGAAETLNSLSIANVNLPVAVFLFAMMYPIMVQIDFVFETAPGGNDYATYHHADGKRNLDRC